MNDAVLLLCVLDLGFIALLPLIFFRRDGRFGAMWTITAVPYPLAAFALLAGRLGWLHPLASSLDSAAVVLCAASLALIAYTLGSHRVRISLWHQTNDSPRSIVTQGAYARVRHPFYAAFLLGLLGVGFALPHLATFAIFAYSLAILGYTAAREERRLLRSDLGREYKSYVLRTGRFLPRWRR